MIERDYLYYGFKKVFVLESITKEYIFEIRNTNDEVTFENLAYRQKLINAVLTILISTIITVIIGFYGRIESLITGSIAGAIFFIGHYISTTEKRMIFSRDHKEYVSFNVFGSICKRISFKKIYGVEIFLDERDFSNILTMKFCENKKVFFSNKLKDFELIPKLRIEIEESESLVEETDESFERLLEIANDIIDISGGTIKLLNETIED